MLWLAPAQPSLLVIWHWADCKIWNIFCCDNRVQKSHDPKNMNNEHDERPWGILDFMIKTLFLASSLAALGVKALGPYWFLPEGKCICILEPKMKRIPITAADLLTWIMRKKYSDSSFLKAFIFSSPKSKWIQDSGKVIVRKKACFCMTLFIMDPAWWSLTNEQMLWIHPQHVSCKASCNMCNRNIHLPL